MPDLIEPRKVKTISVRPDGSVLSNDAAAQQAASDAPVPLPRPTPGSAAARAATPKTAARVVTTPKAPVVASQDAGKTAAQDRDDTRAIKVASAETETTDATSARGGFAVQLAAPGTEDEARQTAAQLGKKFAGELGGHHLTFHRASDKSVYRVRVGGLSRDEATTLCEKLKASGGQCFVAKN
jgi:cell division septation protein DedD